MRLRWHRWALCVPGLVLTAQVQAWAGTPETPQSAERAVAQLMKQHPKAQVRWASGHKRLFKLAGLKVLFACRALDPYWLFSTM